MKGNKEKSAQIWDKSKSALEKASRWEDLQTPSRESLAQMHPELSKLLQNIERNAAIHLIASLETMPKVQGNAVRFQALKHLAMHSCCGDVEPTIAHIRNWVSQLQESPMATQEDPPEDVFIGYVCTKSGGFRVFPGLFSDADFIVERIVSFLEGKRSFPGFQELYDSLIELLRLSDAAIEDLGFARYSIYQSEDRKTIELPPDEIISAHINAIKFDDDQIESLGIDVEKLAPFFLDRLTKNEVSNESLWGSVLEIKPLCKRDRSLVISSPSCICRAAVDHSLQIIRNLGEWASLFFSKECGEFFVNNILRRVGVEFNSSIKLPPAPEDLPPFFPIVGQFDYGLPALGLTLTSSLSDAKQLDEEEVFDESESEKFTEYLDACCQACEETEGFHGGLILLALSGIGRPIGLGIGRLRENWRVYSGSLAEWNTLASDHEFNAKRLWYLGMQEKLAEYYRIDTSDMGGLFNTYSFWKRQGFKLIPSECDIRQKQIKVIIDGSFSQELNAEIKACVDRYCERCHKSGEWILLERKERGLHPDVTENRMYCDHEAANSGVLRGCVAQDGLTWWIEASSRPRDSGALSCAFRLWECVFNWMGKSLPVILEWYPSAAPRSLKFEIEPPDIEQLDLELSGGDIDDERTALIVKEDPENGLCKIVIEARYLKKFYRADNTAEREIVEALLKFVFACAKVDIVESELKKGVELVTVNEGARYFHLVDAQNLESVIGGPENPNAIQVPEEEIARAEIGLAYTVEGGPWKEISDNDSARVFLDKVVAGLQKRLSSRLKDLQIKPLVGYSFSQLDELSREETRWSMSTRALLSLEKNADWMIERIRNEKSRIGEAEIANRVLIETSVYSFSERAAVHVSQTEHASLLAEIVLMIRLANHRDSIVNGFVDANLTIQPNGTIDYSDSFQEKVFQPYLKSRLDDAIKWDSEEYERFFRSRFEDETRSGNKSARIIAFEQAFKAEFGFSFENLVQIVEFFRDIAIQNKQPMGTISGKQFEQILMDEVGFRRTDVSIFKERFVLPIRRGWDKDLPGGCERNDVLPWRYFRGVSLLIRPIVQVSKNPECFFISATHLLRWRDYITRSIFEGMLPDRLFFSTEMKSFFGDVANASGHRFAEEVASALQPDFPDLRLEIKLTELGAASSPDLGDIDVFLWIPERGLVFLLECKHLKAALTVRQAIQQMEEFKGDIEKMDYLGKHKRRVEWLLKYPEKVEKLTGIVGENIIWKPFLVTRGRVPMSYLSDIHDQGVEVVSFEDLAGRISEIAESTPLIQPSDL